MAYLENVFIEGNAGAILDTPVGSLTTQALTVQGNPSAVPVPVSGQLAAPTGTSTVAITGVTQVAPTGSANTRVNPFFTEITDGTSTMGAMVAFGATQSTSTATPVYALNANVAIQQGTVAIAGTSTVEVAGSVTLAGTSAVVGTVDIAGTSTVIVAGTVTVAATGTQTVTIAGTVAVGGTSTVEVVGTSTVTITGSVGISGTSTVEVAGIVGTSTVTVAGTVTVAATGTQTVTVAGSVGISGTPTVEIAGILGGTVAIAGTSTVEVAGIAGTSTVTVAGIAGTSTVVVSGIVEVSATTAANSAGNPIFISGTFAPPTGTQTVVVVGTSTVEVSGIVGTSTVTVAGSVAVTNTVTVEVAGILGTSTVEVAGIVGTSTVVLAGTSVVEGNLTNNNAAPNAFNLGVLPAIAETAYTTATYSTGDQVLPVTDLHGALNSDLQAVAGTALGAPSAYGTPPGAVEVIGVNAFITNSPTVGVAGTVTVEVAGIVGTSTVEVAGIVGTSTVTVAGPIAVTNTQTVVVGGTSTVIVSGIVGTSTVTVAGTSTALAELVANTATGTIVAAGAVAPLQGDLSADLRVNPYGPAGSFQNASVTSTITASATLAVGALYKWDLKSVRFAAIPSNTVTKQAVVWVTDQAGNVMWESASPVFTPTNTLVYEVLLYPGATGQINTTPTSTTTVTFLASARGTNTQVLTLQIPEMYLGPSFQINGMLNGAAGTVTATLSANVLAIPN